MRTRTLGVALAVSLPFLSAEPAQAAARVFVSVFGSDAGDCSNRSTPCRTFGAGITQVDAGGEVIVIDTGSYGGATISKSVKLNVPVGVVAFTASPMTVAAGADDVVVLRGLTIKALTPGTGNGILLTSGAAVHVENCVIDGWANGINVNTNAAVDVFVIDTIVRNASEQGLFVSPAGLGFTPRVTVDNSRFEDSGTGVLVSQGNVTVMRSVAAGGSFGFAALGVNAVLNVDSSIAANNVDGFFVQNSAVMRVARCIVTGNANTGFNNQPGLSTFESLGNNLVRGNTSNTFGTITVVAGQ